MASLAVFLFLASVAYLDFRFRSVYVIIFPCLGLSVFWYSVQLTSFSDACTNFLVNSCLVVLVVGLAVILTRKVLMKSFGELLGWGDLYLLISITSLLKPILFMPFLVVSFLVTLLVHLFIRRLGWQRLDSTVPLAGYVSVLFGGMILVSRIPRLLEYLEGEMLL